MNLINSIRTVALASSFFTGFSLNASAADSIPEKFDGSDGKSAWTLEIGYIQDAFNRSSRNSQANKWAILVDGEVVTIAGQLAVVWTREGGSDLLMVTNFGDQAISEEIKLEYLDGTGKEFLDILVEPGDTQAIPVYRSGSQGTSLNFALYDSEDNFLAQLAWRVQWLVRMYNTG